MSFRQLISLPRFILRTSFGSLLVHYLRALKILSVTMRFSKDKCFNLSKMSSWFCYQIVGSRDRGVTGLSATGGPHTAFNVTTVVFSFINIINLYDKTIWLKNSFSKYLLNHYSFYYIKYCKTARLSINLSKDVELIYILC